MAASHVSCMKMRTLLFGVILGLLAAVHSAPVNAMSPMPAKALDDILREAVTDGFLVENLSLPSGATGSPMNQGTGSPATGSPATGLPATGLPMNQGTGSPATGSPMNQGTGSPATGLPATGLPMNQGTGLPATGSPATGSPMNQGTGSPATGSPMNQGTGLPATGSPATGSPMNQGTGSPATGLPATDSPMNQGTGSPTTNATVQASQQPAVDSKEGVTMEGSGGQPIEVATTSVFLQFGTTTASHAQSAAATPQPRGASSSVSSATQTALVGSTPVPNEGQTSATPNHILASQTTDPAVSTVGFLSTQGSYSGSGDGEMFDLYSTTTTRSSVETSAASLTSATRQKVPVLVEISEGSASGELFEPMPTTTAIRGRQRMIIEPNSRKIFEGIQETSKAAGTPGWMIIVGFVVGLAALVMLFVAIATREKWNGPSRASQLKKRTNSIQHKEMEMETFLQNDHPIRNENGSEYTVIPLEELPGKYSSR
ncbi:uncharacterized protein LOC130193240 [Pseudoliparis swirei]|uniref:uncharacterized protein LOC130193240 n=1 Tax=Pseudoliparis swirei TaxID=2059687 RepID=UPI0024BEBABF|nr:uncharacterized protein LOC130193240 [Pseudoliparis swirei]